MSNKKIGYIWSNNLIKECNRIPCVKFRSSYVHELIKSYNLLNFIKIIESKLANLSDLRLFHSSDYLDQLKKIQLNYYEENDIQGDENDLEYGLGYDCSPIERIWDLSITIAGGTLEGIKSILSGDCDVVINWNGGWHHAERDEAKGFCFINDIAIGIQKLREKFQRVFYIDLDVHHGDGVENAFACTKRVFTLSFHQYENGFFPGTGSIKDCGFGPGLGYAANFPYCENISGLLYVKYFKIVTQLIKDKYKPDVCVIQCGGDVIAGDKLGNANLIPNDLGCCIDEIMLWNLPTIFLGGGGYNIQNTAKYWTYLTSKIIKQEISNDIPDHPYFLEYGPDYDLSVQRKNIKDLNLEKNLQENVRIITENLIKYSVCDIYSILLFYLFI